MFHRTCTNQKTYDLNNKLLREIIYKKTNDDKIIISDVIYYFYQKDRLISKEFYSTNAELNYFYFYQYNSDNKLIKESKASEINNKLIISETKEYSYNQNNTSIITLNEQKKKTSLTTILENNDNKTSSTVFTKKHPLNDSINTITCKSLLKDGLIIEEVIITSYKNNTSDSVKTINKYDNQKQLIESISYKNGIFLEKITFDFYPDGTLKTRILFKPEDKIIDYVSFEKEKIFREFGGLKSVYLEKYNGKL